MGFMSQRYVEENHDTAAYIHQYDQMNKNKKILDLKRLANESTPENIRFHT
jgi:hypothetical protein